MEQDNIRGKTEEEAKMLFLLKTMKAKHVEDTMKKGRFCFNHPGVFNKWERQDSAQFDAWDAHSARYVRHVIFAPILEEREGLFPLYGEPQKLADEAVMRFQSNYVKHSPICCFRIVDEDEVVIGADSFSFSLGDIVDRIMTEFGHDSYVMINARAFHERLYEKTNFIARFVTYRDTTNDYEFKAPAEYKDIIEQLFRKDERFEWQKEYRIVLPPSEDSPVFVELGSIKDIAFCGKISDLRV